MYYIVKIIYVNNKITHIAKKSIPAWRAEELGMRKTCPSDFIGLGQKEYGSLTTELFIERV